MAVYSRGFGFMATILYIEDNPQNMRLVRKILTAAGYSMVEAVDGYSGLSAAADYQPHLILLDINLPDIDGLDVLARLRGEATLAHIPVIALTANAMPGDRERFLHAGCNGYLSKPLNKAELLAHVEHYLQSV